MDYQINTFHISALAAEIILALKAKRSLNGTGWMSVVNDHRDAKNRKSIIKATNGYEKSYRNSLHVHPPYINISTDTDGKAWDVMSGCSRNESLPLLTLESFFLLFPKVK